MLIPSIWRRPIPGLASLSRRVNANSQLLTEDDDLVDKLIKKGEC